MKFIWPAQGASPAGDKPFLDRFNLATGKAETALPVRQPV